MNPTASDDREQNDPSSPEAPRRRRILAVVNPVAGPLGSQRAAKDLEERAKKQGLELDVVLTQPDLDGEAAVASREGEAYDAYLVVGGDGTVMEVATAAMARNVPLAILPRGTANAVAWHFGIPFDVARALKVAVEGRAVRIDVGRAGERDFLLMAGLGYDAHLIRDATRELKRRLGFLAYLIAALRNVGRQPYSFRAVVDDGPPLHLAGVSAAVVNMATFAGNIRAVKGVSPEDGKLDLIVISSANFSDFFRLFFRSLLGKVRDDPRVRVFPGSTFHITCRPRAPLEIDGDALPRRRETLEAQILPRALSLIVPPEGMLRVPWMPEFAWNPPNLNLPSISRSKPD